MPTPKVLLIHGFNAQPNGGWRLWLMSQLADQGIYAWAAAMPQPHQPNCQDWIDEIDHQLNLDPNAEHILIGHSLGGTSILRYLEKHHNPRIKAAILVSSPCHLHTEPVIASFLDHPLDFATIANHCPHFTIIHGQNDPLVPYTEAQTLSQSLNASLITIPNGHHLNSSAGWTQLPQILEPLKPLLQPRG